MEKCTTVALLAVHTVSSYLVWFYIESQHTSPTGTHCTYILCTEKYDDQQPYIPWNEIKPQQNIQRIAKSVQRITTTLPYRLLGITTGGNAFRPDASTVLKQRLPLWFVPAVIVAR